MSFHVRERCALWRDPRYTIPIVCCMSFHRSLDGGFSLRHLVNGHFTSAVQLRRHNNTPLPVSALMLSLILLSPLISPVAGEWEEDSWLSNIIGPERLEAGDEFGCHGMVGEHFPTYLDEIKACRDYLIARAPASRWGSNPISLGLDEARVAQVDAAEMAAAGFRVVDNFEKSSHLSSIVYNGGSLEKNVGSLADYDALLDTDVELINFYWMGRDHDVVVRPQSDLVAAIESTPAWLTTWGEHYSYQATSRRFNTSNPISDVWNVSLSYVADTGADGDAWLLPISNRFRGIPADVVHVKSSGEMLPELSSDTQHLQTGWYQVGSDLILTLAPRMEVEIQFESSAIAPRDQVSCPLFNCHKVAITVAGHHTSDLFDWSRRWDDSPLRFTWLVEPREVGQFSWILPTAALIIAIAAPVAIIWLVKKDHRAQRAAALLYRLDEMSGEQE